MNKQSLTLQEQIELNTKQSLLIKVRKDVALALLSNPHDDLSPHDIVRLTNSIVKFIFSEDVEILNNISRDVICSF